MSDMWEDIEHLKVEDQGAALAADALEIGKESVIVRKFEVEGTRADLYFAAYTMLEHGLKVRMV